MLQLSYSKCCYIAKCFTIKTRKLKNIHKNYVLTSHTYWNTLKNTSKTGYRTQISQTMYTVYNNRNKKNTVQ